MDIFTSNHFLNKRKNQSKTKKKNRKTESGITVLEPEISHLFSSLCLYENVKFVGIFPERLQRRRRPP